VTWHESGAGAPGLPATDSIEVATVNAAGVSSSPLPFDSADAGFGLPSIASNGDRVLVAWGTPFNTLREALFDAGGKQLGKFIDLAWPYAFTRTRTHAMAGGFATLAGTRIALTSSDGRALDTIDVPSIAAGADFVVDPANRFTFIYSHTVASTGTATFAQTVGLPRRHPSNR
jgi:hypothetical protein